MVLFWKRLCSLCGCDPPSGDSSFPDLRDNEDYMELARAFKVMIKRRCPICPECTNQMNLILEFVEKTRKSQDFISECSQRRLFNEEEIQTFRTEFFSGKAKPIKRESTKPVPMETKEEPGEEDTVNNFLEIIAAKEEDLSEENVHEVVAEEESMEHEDEGREEDEEGNSEESESEFDLSIEEESLKDTVVVMDESEKKVKVKKEKKFLTPRNPAKTTRKFKYNFKCKQCPTVLHSKHHLELHEKKHDPVKKVLKPHICEHCGKAFAAVSLLRAHSTRHSDERPFPCDVCGMAFKNAYGLKCHQETHDDKKYICPICGLALGSNHTYHAHLKIHSDKRQYKCLVCPKTFKRHTPLKEHLFGHADMRPYSCPFCEKTFVNGSSCRLHKVRVHPKELAELEASGRNEEVLEQHRNMCSMEQIKDIIRKKFGLDKSMDQYQPQPQPSSSETPKEFVGNI